MRDARSRTARDGTVQPVPPPLEQIYFTFRRNGVGYAKTIDFYLMHAVGGDTSHHDGTTSPGGFRSASR
jgi:hypothetical protein